MIITKVFIYSKDKVIYPKVLYPIDSNIICEDVLPRTIESKNSINVIIDVGVLTDKKFRNVKDVIFNTADGSIFHGKSKALKQMIKLEDLPDPVERRLKKYNRIT